MDTDKLNNSFRKCKLLISKMVKTKNHNLLIPIQKTSKEIVLILSNFQCKRCSSKTELQLHHLIPRKAKDYMEMWHYLSCRYYYGNQIILCNDCHIKYHNIVMDDQDIRLSITQQTIDKVKRKYSI